MRADLADGQYRDREVPHVATGRMTHRRATIGSAVVLALYEYDARDRLITETGTSDRMARLWLRPDGT